jgi:molybdate transport system substrate-binding protein
MMRLIAAGRMGLAALLLGACTTLAGAGEIKVLSTIAFQRVFHEAVPAFDRASGNTVKVDFGGSAAVAGRVRNGEAADVYFGARKDMDELVAAGKVRAGSVVTLANSQAGFGVRKGAPKPDISTAAKLKSAILASKGITYPDPASGSPSGNQLVKIAAQLGVADALASRTRRPPGGGAAGPVMLNTGEADLAFQQNCELLLAPNVELIGPLPSEFELITPMVAAVPIQAHDPEAAMAFIRFLQTPAEAALMHRWGLEPLAK